MSSTSPQNIRRRVPAALRRRAVVSCDRCKQRRSRCVRSSPDTQSCEACLSSRSICETTIARKQRVYGSVETLNARYRVLEALVKGFFPDENLGTVTDLVQLATDNGITIPDIEASEVAIVDSQSELPPATGSSHRRLTNSSNTWPSDTELLENINSNDSTLNKSDNSSTDISWPCDIDQIVHGTVAGLPEETCITAPHGVAHYVGPASTFDFANSVRRLVKKCSKPSQDNERSRLRAGFTNLPTSIALEPRIEAHPAAIVRDQHDTPMSGDGGTDKTSPTHEQDTCSQGQSQSEGYREWLQGILPTRRIADSLIQAFFDRVHPNYLLFHRGSFQTRYGSIWRSTTADSLKAEPGWLCCLFMVCVFGAQALEKHQPEDSTNLQRRFLKHVRARFTQLALTASLANVQALLLLQLYEHSAGERNTAWILLGQATRMAIALGMHREGTLHNFDPMEANTRRVVWHTLYAFEQYVSLQLGRPTTMKALEVNIGLPDESLLDGNNLPAGHLKHESQLLDLTRKVHHFATAASPNCFNVDILVSLLESAASLGSEFDIWRRNLPSHLVVECTFHSPRHRRSILLLHMMYHHIRSTITRPYLLCKINLQLDNYLVHDAALANPIPEKVMILGDQCVASASAVAQIVRLLLGENLLETIIWTDIFYLYHALMLISVSFLSAKRLESVQYTQLQQNLHEDVKMMVNICQSHRLAPTYHILSSVAIQLAQIVGLTGDGGPSRDEIGNGNQQQDIWPNTIADGSNFMFEPLSDLQYFGGMDDYLNWNFFDVNNNAGQTSHFEYAPAVLPNPFSDLFPNHGQQSQSQHSGDQHG